MEKKRISTILFDLGNVLFDLDIPATEEALSNLLGQHSLRFKNWAVKQQFFERYEIGEISDELFIEKIGEHCLPGTTEQMIINAWNAMLLGMPADRLQWLKELRSIYQVALLSNTNALHIAWVRQFLANGHQVTEFETTHFDRVYYSHEIGARKPDENSFQYVLDDLDVDPSEILFIDDVPENTKTAASMGIRTRQHRIGNEIMIDLPRYIKSLE